MCIRDRSRTYVRVDHSEFAVVLDEITQRALEAQAQSDEGSQSLGITWLLALGLAEDTGEYVIDGNNRWQLATESPGFLATMGQLNAVSDGEFGEQEALEFGESLGGKWLRTEVNERAAPSFQGFGDGLPKRIDLQLEAIGVDGDLRILGQRADASSTILETEAPDGHKILFEFDESGELREIQFDVVSRTFGIQETHRVVFGDFEPGLVAIPSADAQLDPAEFWERVIDHLEANFPDVLESAQESAEASAVEFERFSSIELN